MVTLLHFKCLKYVRRMTVQTEPTYALVNRELDRIISLNFNPTPRTFFMNAGFTREGGNINPWVKNMVTLLHSFFQI